MKSLLALCTIFFLCISAMKRPYKVEIPDDEDMTPDAKRPCLTDPNEKQVIPKMTMIEAMKRNNVEAFEAAYERDIEKMFNYSKYKLLSEASNFKYAFFFCRLLSKPEFRKALSYAVACLCLENHQNLYVLATTHFHEGEAEFMSDRDQLRALIGGVMPLYYPAVREVICRKFGFDPASFMPNFPLVSEIYDDEYQRIVSELAPQYFYCSNLPASDIEIIRSMCDGLVLSLRSKYPLEILEIVSSDSQYYNEKFALMIVHISLALGEPYLLDIIEEIWFKFELGDPVNTTAIIKMALRQSCYTDVRNILSVGAHNEYKYLLQTGFIDELVKSGDILALAELRKNNVQISPGYVPLVNFAEAVMKTDLRFVLLFMEMHPNQLILIDAAWNLLHTRNPELIFKFIYGSMFPNREAICENKV